MTLLAQVMLSGTVVVMLLGAGLLVTGAVTPFEPAPSAQFHYEYDAAADSVTVTHSMGSTFDGERLHVVGSDGADLGGWDQTRVGAGDSTTVTVPADGTVRLVYDDPFGRTVIGTWQRPT